MTMRADTLITVIVSTYNRPDALSAVLRACFAQTDRHFEIIVTDDGSDGATAACIDQLRPLCPVQLEHVWQPDAGYRLAMARNRAILRARGQYILLLDGDCIPQPGHVATHRKLAQPGFMVTGSRVLLSRDFTGQVLAQAIDVNALGTLDKLRLRARGDINKVAQLLFTLPDLGRVRKRFSYRRIKGCNLGAWRADLERVNGFDESFKGWGHEDADLVLRLYHAGVLRKDGAYATEVMHLWHPDAQRDQAESNKSVVLQRALERTTQAAQGLREHPARAAAAPPEAG